MTITPESSRAEKHTRSQSGGIGKNLRNGVHPSSRGEPEHDVDSRENAIALGFTDIPGSDTENDLQTDLNSRTLRSSNDESVDSLSGDESGSDAGLLADYDTITDSNSLTSASTIAGAYGLQNAPRLKEGQTEDDVRGENARDLRAEFTDDRDSHRMEDRPDENVRDASDASLGLTDVSDEETIRGYEEAERKIRTAGAMRRSSGNNGAPTRTP